MICIIAGNSLEAAVFARGQQLRDDEWFYPRNPDDLLLRTNFHVLVVGSAGQNVPSDYFEMVLKLAKEQGRKR